MQYAVHALSKLTKRSIIWHKTQEEPSRVLTTFGIHLERSPSKCNKRKIQPKTWNTAKKNSFQLLKQVYPSKHWCKKEAANSFLHFCLKRIWAPGQRQVCISWISRFFSSLRRPETHFCLRHALGHQRAGASRRSIEIIRTHLLQYTK